MASSTPSLLELLVFFHDAILVSIMVGAILAPIGLFLHLRRNIFLGAALPQIAGFSFVAGDVLSIPKWIAAGIALIVFAIVSNIKKWNKNLGINSETIIALGYSVAMAGTILLLALTNAEAHASELLLKGSVLTAKCSDTQTLAWIGIPLILLLYLFQKRLFLISIDPEMARILGIHVNFYEFMLNGIFGISIILTLIEAGALACFAFMLIPSLCAQALCNRVSRMFLVSEIIGILGAAGGITISLAYDLPAGPAMVIFLIVLWIVSLLAGFLWNGKR
ncbi:MAG: metal ABC transporter permease [Candidatus Riflebacteria bacterium]|nr:metal ABC transporter permease [Candidatus Riflebacteria bacterium]